MRALLFGFFLLASSLSAQLTGIEQAPVDSGSVRGTVQPAVGTPGMIKVELVSQQGLTSSFMQLTDGDGGFYFANVPLGQYELVVTSNGDQQRRALHVMGMELVDVKLGSEAKQATGGAGPVSVARLRIPDKAISELRKARDAVSERKTRSAMEHLDKAIAKAPDFAEALVLRGVLRLDAGALQQAEQDLDTAIKADPSFQLGYVAFAALKINMNQPDAALKALESAERLGSSWQLHLEKGKALTLKGDYEAALKSLEKAEQTAPRFTGLYMAKAKALAALGNKEAARREIAAAISGSRDPEELVSLNRVLLQLQ